VCSFNLLLSLNLAVLTCDVACNRSTCTIMCVVCGDGQGHSPWISAIFHEPKYCELCRSWLCPKIESVWMQSKQRRAMSG